MSLFPASRDCAPAGGNAVHSSEASAFPALGKNGLRETPANTGPRLLGTISGTAFLAVAVAHCCALVRLSRNRSAVLRSCPTSEAALSADIRGDFPPKKRRPSARRPVFPLPAWEQPTQSKKTTAKACFPSPRVKTAAPRAPPRPTSRMTHVFDAPHGNDALALFSPPAAVSPRQNRPRSLKQRGRPAGLFGRKGGGAACVLPKRAGTFSVKSVETVFSNSEGISRRGTSQNPAPRVPSVHRMFLRAAEELPRRRRASAGLPRFRAQKRRREVRRLFISTLQPETRRLLPPFPRPRRDEWEP